MGGMIAATFLAIFFVPMFFKLITDRHLREPRSTDELFAEVQHHRETAHHPPPATPGHPPRPWAGDDHA
jgi:hypothetical protein